MLTSTETTAVAAAAAAAAAGAGGGAKQPEQKVHVSAVWPHCHKSFSLAPLLLPLP